MRESKPPSQTTPTRTVHTNAGHMKHNMSKRNRPPTHARTRHLGARLLERLREGGVLLQVAVRHGAPRVAHRLLEVPEGMGQGAGGG